MRGGERVSRVVGGDVHAASDGGETGGRRGGAAPALASLLRVRDEPGMRRCLFALHVLAGRSLPVRVTGTAEQVWPVLDVRVRVRVRARARVRVRVRVSPNPNPNPDLRPVGHGHAEVAQEGGEHGARLGEAARGYLGGGGSHGE